MSRAGRILVLPLIAIALTVSACGDDEPEAATVTETETATESTSESSEETSTTSAGEEGTPTADQTVSSLAGFTSADGNVGCLIEPSNVRCDIRDRDWKPPPAPDDCQLDYGQGIELGAGAEPAFVCAGDTALDAGEPIPKGGSIAAGLIFCEVEASGVSCRDVETGRGFSIDDQAYELF